MTFWKRQTVKIGKRSVVARGWVWERWWRGTEEFLSGGITLHDTAWWIHDTMPLSKLIQLVGTWSELRYIKFKKSTKM